jgi:hypothetical protein
MKPIANIRQLFRPLSLNTKNTIPVNTNQAIQDILVPQPRIMRGKGKDLRVRKVSTVNREGQTVKTIVMHRGQGNHRSSVTTGLFHDFHQKDIGQFLLLRSKSDSDPVDGSAPARLFKKGLTGGTEYEHTWDQHFEAV